jgi:hypothetical protein
VVGGQKREKKKGEKRRGNREESIRDLSYSKRDLSAAAAQKIRMALVAQKAACGSGVRSGVRPLGWDNVRRRLPFYSALPGSGVRSGVPTLLHATILTPAGQLSQRAVDVAT